MSFHNYCHSSLANYVEERSSLLSFQTLASFADGIIPFDGKFFCNHRSHNHLISLDILNASHNEIGSVKLYRSVICQDVWPN